MPINKISLHLGNEAVVDLKSTELSLSNPFNGFLAREKVDETLIEYYQKNETTIRASINAIKNIVDDLTANYQSMSPLGNGYVTCVKLVSSNASTRNNEPQIKISFFDFQNKSHDHVTGALSGFFAGIATASKSKEKPVISWSHGQNETAITFSSLKDLVLALNTTARSQDEKIVLGSEKGRF